MPGNFLLTTLLPTLVSAALIWAWPRRWTDEVCRPSPNKSRDQAQMAVYVLLGTVLLVAFLVALAPGDYGDTHQREFGTVDVVGQALVWGIALLPMVAGVKSDRLGWRDLQFRRTNILPSIVLGTLIFRQADEGLQPADLDDIELKHWVRVWFTEPPEDTFPVEATAAQIVIVGFQSQ